MRNFAGTQISTTATEKWLAAVQAGTAFGGFGNQAAVAAQFAHVQLFNPAASGKVVLVRAIMMAMGVASAFNISVDNVQRTTDVTAGVNLLSGGAAGVAHIRTESNGVAQGAAFLQYAVQAILTFTPPIEWFMQLAPGQGLSCVGTQVNQQLFGTYMWIEL